MLFKDFEVGNYYGLNDRVLVYKFMGMYNDYIAKFNLLEYDEVKGDYFCTNEFTLLTKEEVKNFIKW